MSERLNQLNVIVQQLSLKSDELRDRIEAQKSILSSLELEYGIVVRQKDQMLGRLCEAQDHDKAVKEMIKSINPETPKKSKTNGKKETR